MSLRITEERMREITAPYLQSGEEILTIGYSVNVGLWKNIPYVISLTKNRFLFIQVGRRHSNYEVRDMSEIQLDQEFSYYLKKGTSALVMPRNYARTQRTMNTLYFYMPDGSKRFYTFSGKDNKETPVRMSEFLAEMGKPMLDSPPRTTRKPRSE